MAIFTRLANKTYSDVNTVQVFIITLIILEVLTYVDFTIVENLHEMIVG